MTGTHLLLDTVNIGREVLSKINEYKMKMHLRPILVLLVRCHTYAQGRSGVDDLLSARAIGGRYG